MGDVLIQLQREYSKHGKHGIFAALGIHAYYRECAACIDAKADFINHIILD